MRHRATAEYYDSTNCFLAGTKINSHMQSLNGKVALITGGAVGTALAQRFLKAGSNVAFVFRDAGREKILRTALANHTDDLRLMRADLDSHDDATRVSDAVGRAFGGIDFLVNSLGGWIGGKKLHEHSPSEVAKMFDMDFVPTFNIMSAVLPKMVEQKFGRIVNFVAMQVFGSGAGNAVYSASKSAVLALTMAAAEEYKGYGISVNAIAPSTIDTAANRKSMPKADTSKWVKVEEIVDAVMFLCGAESSVNGTVLKFLTK